MSLLRNVKRNQKKEAAKILKQMLKDPRNLEVRAYVNKYYQKFNKVPELEHFKAKDGSYIWKIKDQLTEDELMVES